VTHVQESVKLFISRQATLEEVIEELVKKLPNISTEISDRIRLFDVHAHKEYKEFLPSQTLTTTSIETSYGASFFAEAVPMEELEMAELDRFVIVIHFTKELTRLHGIPVKFVLKPVWKRAGVPD
jgi:ubiquitin carboxyl-terminal hydrolase 7